jgi:hypothetical protein
MRSGDRVVIGFCDPGEVDGAFCADLFNLAGARATRLGPLLRVHGTGLLSRIRNELVAGFLDRTTDQWLLMVDTDQRLPLQSFDRLVSAGHDVARPVVSGLVFAAYGRGELYPVPVPAIFRRGPDGLVPVDDYPPDRIIPVDAHGTGCVLVHRGALQALRDAAPAHLRDWCWFQDGPGDDGRWLSEDLTFCARLQAAGVPLHAHTGAVLPHHKSFWLTAAHHDLWRSHV